MDFYNALIAEKENSTVQLKTLEDGKVQVSSGTGEARVEHIALYNEAGQAVEHLNVGEPARLRIKVKVYRDLDSLVLGYGIKDRLGQVMHGTNTWYTQQSIEQPRAGDLYTFDIIFKANLGPGSYSVQTALVDKETHLTANYEWRDLALVFTVSNFDKIYFAGCNWLNPDIEISKA